LFVKFPHLVFQDAHSCVWTMLYFCWTKWKAHNKRYLNWMLLNKKNPISMNNSWFLDTRNSLKIPCSKRGKTPMQTKNLQMKSQRTMQWKKSCWISSNLQCFILTSGRSSQKTHLTYLESMRLESNWIMLITSSRKAGRNKWK